MDAIKFAVLDLETIPCQSLPPDCIPAFDEASVAVGNLKDLFKIREKIDEARAKFDADLDKRLSVDPDFCEVCCAVTINCSAEGETFCWTNRPDGEYHLLINVWDWISQLVLAGIPLVTFNGLTFDLPVLIKRAIYNDVSVSPRLIKTLLSRQEYNSTHYDLMQLLAHRSPFSGKLEAKNLNFYLNRSRRHGVSSLEGRPHGSNC
jgi:predicted PolB exonuclease-like 3'-5' exonuclease